MAKWQYEEWENNLLQDIGKLGDTESLNINDKAYIWCSEWCNLLNQFGQNGKTIFASVKIGQIKLGNVWNLDVDLDTKIQLMVITKDDMEGSLPFLFGLEYVTDKHKKPGLLAKKTISYDLKNPQMSDTYQWNESFITSSEIFSRIKFLDLLSFEFITYLQWLTEKKSD